MSRYAQAVLTAATWNIHGGRDRKRRQFQYAHYAGSIGADVVGLQELELHRVTGGGYECIGLKDSGFEHSEVQAFSDSPFSSDADLAVALLSCATFISTDAVMLPNPVRSMGIDPTFHDKGLILSEIVWNNTAIDVMSLHLFPFHRIGLDARDPRLQIVWSILDELLPPRPNVPRIILGDFNTPYRFELLKCLQLGELRSMFLNSPSRDDGESHDDILVSSQWRPRQLRNMPTESDHNLLVANLVLNST
jgi:endonuclease/exonuclease/phosphatase family metal-dependent hydrolase